MSVQFPVTRIRNFCVARGVIQAPFTGVVFNVPPSTNLILRSVVLQSPGPDPVDWGVILVAPDPPVWLWLDAQNQMPTGRHVISEWLVLNSFDSLSLYVVGGPLLYWISGALLPTGSGVLTPAIAAAAGEWDTWSPRPGEDPLDWQTRGSPEPQPYPPLANPPPT